MRIYILQDAETGEYSFSEKPTYDGQKGVELPDRLVEHWKGIWLEWATLQQKLEGLALNRKPYFSPVASMAYLGSMGERYEQAVEDEIARKMPPSGPNVGILGGTTQ